MGYKGVVQKGEQTGQELGFPTINIPLQGETPEGIFAAKVSVDEKIYFAAAYANTERGILEAHLLDFSDDLYGKEVEIELVEKIRKDKKFANVDELKQAIAEDVAKVRKSFTT
jgi:riboflavin kinase / FMN adenylyltransferase